MVERVTRNDEVPGSIPGSGSSDYRGVRRFLGMRFAPRFFFLGTSRNVFFSVPLFGTIVVFTPTNPLKVEKHGEARYYMPMGFKKTQ